MTDNFHPFNNLFLRILLNLGLKIYKKEKALLEGHFILSSGLHSPQYVQCAQLLSKPYKANKICLSLSEKISKSTNPLNCN